MQTKVSVSLLLAAGALLMCAGCGHQETLPPAPVVPSASAPVGESAAAPAPADQGAANQGAANAAQALNSPNTPPEAKAYIRDHQTQINQSQTAPTGTR